MKSIVKRIVATVVVTLIYGWINALLNPVATILTGQLAGKQFENSDVAYVESVVGMNFFSNIGIPALALLAVLVWIWWKPLVALLKSLKDGDDGSSLVIAGLVASGLFFGMTDNANAYYDKTDLTEIYYIGADETAFWIPDVGANKDSQGKFDSEGYYEANKIPAKRFEIKHTKLVGSTAAMERDYYVPVGRLYVVKRTPYTRDWTKSTHTGTSTKNESFECQSKEGLNQRFEVSIGVTVLPENAAKYLYHFGTQVSADKTPATMFASVLYATSVTTVMDGVGRSKVSALLCKEFAKRTFDEGNTKLAEIMDKVETDARTFFEARGIKLEFLGTAGTIEFDPDVQKAINDKYIAQTVGPFMGTLQQRAEIGVKEGLQEGLKKFGLPSFLPPSLGEWVGKIFGSQSSAAAAAAAVKK